MTFIYIIYRIYAILVSWISPTYSCQFSNNCHFHCKINNSVHRFSMSYKFHNIYWFFLHKIYIFTCLVTWASHMIKSCEKVIWPSHIKIESLRWYRFDMKKSDIALISIWYVLQDVYFTCVLSSVIYWHLHCQHDIKVMSHDVMMLVWLWIPIKLTFCAHRDIHDCTIHSIDS